MSLTHAESELCSAIGFDPTVLDLGKLKTGKSPERLMAITEDDEDVPADGLSFSIRRDEVDSHLADLQPLLGSMGYRAFWSERRLPNGMAEGHEMAILKTTDPYAILGIKQTNGANNSVFLPDILARLEAWKALCECEVIGAASSWVALRFSSLPGDLCAFAEEVYSFCPDSVEQGVGLVTERADRQLYARARTICPGYTSRTKSASGNVLAEMLTWEMRSNLGSKGQAQNDETRDILKGLGADIEDPLLAFVQSVYSGRGRAEDMGVRLLAAEIERSRFLFLWWD